MGLKNVGQYWKMREAQGFSRVKNLPLSFYTHELSAILIRQQKLRGWCWPPCAHCGKRYRRPAQTGGKGKYCSWCYECRGPNSVAIGFLRKFDLSYNEWSLLKDRCENLCEICRSPPGTNGMYRGEAAELQVDHDHSTGKVRGLLCWRCNIGIEHLEREGWLEPARRYLERTRLEAILPIEGCSEKPS